MSAHDESHERLLEALVTGARDERELEAAAVLAACRECRDALAGMRATAAALDDAADDEAARIREALALDSAPGDELVRDTVRALARPRGPRLPAWIALPLAAAVLVAAGVLLQRQFGGAAVPTGPGPDDPRTLSTAVEGVFPANEVDAYGVFQWEAERPDLGGFMLVVASDVPGVDFERRAEDLLESRWDPGDTTTWPDRIRWKVFEVGFDGRRTLLFEQSAWRRSD